MKAEPPGQQILARLDRVPLRGDGGRPVDPVDLELRPGTFYLLVGDDEAARQGLLDLLSLDRRPAAGSFFLFGEKAARPRPGRIAALRRRIGQLRDSLPLLPHLDLYDNVALPLRIAGVDEGELNDRVAEMLGLTALGACAGLDIGQLSPPERCAAAMARALVGRPDLLLIEDMFDRLPPDWVWRLRRLAESACARGAAVVAATRDEGWAAGLAGARTIRISRPAPRFPFLRSLW